MICVLRRHIHTTRTLTATCRLKRLKTALNAPDGHLRQYPITHNQIQRRKEAAGGEGAAPFHLKANRFGFTLTGRISQKHVFATPRKIE